MHSISIENMQIAYIVLNLEERSLQSGVGKKISTQIRLWREYGHHVQLYLLSPDEFEFDGQICYQSGTQDSFFFIINLLKRELSRIKTLKRLIRDVEEYQPDVIYLRYGLFTYPIHKIVQSIPTIVELNTNDIVEYRYRGLFHYWFNRLTRRLSLGNAAGLVMTSFEMDGFPENRILRVIANGVDFDAIESLPAPSNHHPVIALAATPGYPWHGVDKLCDLARHCSDMSFLVIGYSSDDYSGEIPKNMSFLGFLRQEKIRECLSRADVAVGTLALHRNNMDEGSPLKVREALGYGLPVIYAYQDTDLEDLDAEFLLRLPNTESNVVDNLDRIKAFAYAMRGKRVDRTLILERVDQKLKEEKRLDFFQKILESS